MTDLTDHWRKLYQNNWLGAWDLYVGGRYREVTVTIVAVRYDWAVREGGIKNRVLVLDVKGRKSAPPPMIVSKTSGKSLQAMFGELPQGWVGKEITLYAKQKKTKDGPAWVLTVRNTAAGREMREQLTEQLGPRLDPSELDAGSDDPDKGP